MTAGQSDILIAHARMLPCCRGGGGPGGKIGILCHCVGKILEECLTLMARREQANWDMAAILELQSVPFSFRKKTGGAAYCKKSIESMCVKLR